MKSTKSNCRGEGEDPWQRLFFDNQGLVYAALTVMKPTLGERDDYIQEGMIGLWNAARRYDPTKGKFSSYAVSLILGHMRLYRERRCVTFNYRPGSAACHLLSDSVACFQACYGRAPDGDSELAAFIGCKEEELKEVRAFDGAQRTLSLTSRLEGENCSLEERLAEEREDDFRVDNSLHRAFSDEWVEGLALQEALDALPEPRMKELLVLRYYHGWSQADSARAIGISPWQASRWERRALTHMRAHLGLAYVYQSPPPRQCRRLRKGVLEAFVKAASACLERHGYSSKQSARQIS